MQPSEFSQMFEGETFEQVLAYMFSLPSIMGLEEGSAWFMRNVFHLRVSDFEVLAELVQWRRDGDELVGELVVPFKGDRSDAYPIIKGGVRTQRSIIGLQFLEIGIGLMADGSTERVE